MDFIYATNPASQSVAAAAPVTVVTTVRRYGSIDVKNGAVALSENGWYKVTATVTFQSAAGEAAVSVYQDGVQVTGATSSLTAEATTTYTLVVTAIVRKTGCPCSESILTIVNSGATALTVSAASIVVEKE